MSRIPLTADNRTVARQSSRRCSRSGWSATARGTASATVLVPTLAFLFAFGAPGSLEAVPDSGSFLAQAQPAKGGGGLRLNTKSEPTSGSRDSRNPRSASTSGSRPSRAESSSSPRSTEPAPASADAESAAAAPADDESSKGSTASLRGWIREYATWIVAILACTIAGVFAWVLLGRSRSGAGDEVFADLGEDASTGGASGSPGRRYSTTRIRASEVNARVQSTEFETDQDYALIVDEEALKKPEIDEHTGCVYAESSSIDSLIGEQKFDEAYESYIGRVEEDGHVEFRADLERSLGDHFLGQKDFDRASRVLEHHVATHAAEDIDAETYFNLGYVHFFSSRPQKSQRFLKLYVEHEGVPERADRAKRILETLEATGPLS